MTSELFWSIECMLLIFLSLFACGECWCLSVLHQSFIMGQGSLRSLSFLVRCGCAIMCLVGANAVALLMLEVLLAERAGSQPSPRPSPMVVAVLGILVTAALLFVGGSRAHHLSRRAKTTVGKGKRSVLR